MLLCRSKRKPTDRWDRLQRKRAGTGNIFTQFDEHLPLQVQDLPGGLVQGAAEPHLGPEQLQAVSDHVVHVDGERVILGPNIQTLLPPDVALHTEASFDWLDT